MKILHPNKDKYLSIQELKEYYKDGYYKIIDEKNEQGLNYFLSSFEAYGKNKGPKIIERDLYDNLPFSIHTKVWKERQKDIKIIDYLIGNKPNLSVLDIGSWNGWLSNYLSKRGHEVISTNIFIDEINGLSAKKYYDSNFISLQLFADELFRIDHKFDIIIFNRNWPYIKNEKMAFIQAKKLLNKNGVILFTGLPLYRKSVAIEKKLKLADDEFMKNYGISLYYNERKGYLNNNDMLWFNKNNIQIKPYNKMKYFLKMAFPKKALLCYGSFKK
jgi:2-polyprenyl-3-methyl-5-hydroxy-6-metoxy-1,4-benzoquinol methylase